MTVAYLVGHETRYSYTSLVSTSQHVAYLRPRELAHQRLRQHELTIEPVPAQRTARTDYYGNRVDQFVVLTPHLDLRVSSHSTVEIDTQGPPPDPETSMAWDEVRRSLEYRKGGPWHEATRFAYASPYVTVGPELADFARDAFRPGRPLLAAAIDLMHRIHGEFTFDSTATTIATPVTRVLADRHGVCQDFAHLQIACLRSMGLAARYVSGYLLTDPPPGQPRLAGADASHAWLSVHCPPYGWVDLDPTNDMLAGVRHITLAWGRDYGDVSPLRGVILGGTHHTLKVGVSVVPL